jgi:hypothetical protein
VHAAATGVEVGDDQAALAARERLAPLLDGIGDPFLHAACRLVMAWTAAIVADLDGASQGRWTPWSSSIARTSRSGQHWPPTAPASWR